MNNLKTYIISAAVAIIVVIGGLLAYHPSSQTVIEPQVVKGTSPEIASPYLIVNGITEWYSKEFFSPGNNTVVGNTLSTTTLCSFPAPFATSTLSASTTPQLLSIRVDIASSTAIEIDVATSSSPAATSGTPFIKNFIVGANASSSGIFWLNPGGANLLYQKNSEYINVIAGGGANSPGITGNCQLESTQY